MTTVNGSIPYEITANGNDVYEVTANGSVAWKKIGEVGETTLSTTIDGGAVNTVSFTNTYSNPIVVAYITTRGGGQSIQVRIRNLTTTDCEIFLEEPDNQGHATETVNYCVMDQGEWELFDGAHIEANTHTTNTVLRGGDSALGDTVSYTTAYGSTPAIFHTLNTYNNGEFMATQANSVGTSSFNLSQEALETGIGASTEDIGWIAFDTSVNSNINTLYEANYANDGSNDGVEDTPHTISYSQSFGSTPHVIVSQQTRNGRDGGYARSSGTQNNSSGHETYSEEDQVSDTERLHADETFGWFAIEQNATIYGRAL